MEVNARVYAIADDESLLDEVRTMLRDVDENLTTEETVVMPNLVLPLTRTWYGFRAVVESLAPDDGWAPCLWGCAQLLKKRGAVIVDFWSPDEPDDFMVSLHTLSGGGVDEGKRCMLAGYRRALGADDIRLVYRELVSGRSQHDRDMLAAHRQRRDSERWEKGDYEIEDGVLVKYLGTAYVVRVPDGVTALGDLAFADERALEDMMLNGLEYEAPRLKRLIIPDGVRKIGASALTYCLDLREVEIPDSVTQIGARAFEGCAALERLAFPAGITEIPERALFRCGTLKSVVIPSGVTRVGEEAFGGCGYLMRVKLPGSVRVIGKAAFRNCARLKKVVIPEGLTEIGASAFEGCAALEQVTLPKSLRHIGADAFKGCRSLNHGSRMNA